MKELSREERLKEIPRSKRDELPGLRYAVVDSCVTNFVPYLRSRQIFVLCRCAELRAEILSLLSAMGQREAELAATKPMRS